MNARSRWARRMIDAAEKPLPAYGSPEWLALPDHDRRKVAAVVVAAECWATDLDNLPERIRLEAEAHKRIEDAAYVERWQAHHAEWRDMKPCRGAYADRMGVAS